MEAPPFALYNPALLPPDVLLSEFTARRPLLARLLDIIRANDPGEPPQHVLCVGPRGMGKTTLLCAISATLKLREPDLAQHWQPVIFDEESRRIGDLADFWLECIRQWESETEPSLTRSHRIDALLAKPGPDIEDQAREVFLQLVDASGKRALLLIDNLNDIFIAVNDAESLMRLRSFLMSDPRVMIIGAATRWFSDVTGLDKPFFEFFRPFDLHALSLEEMRECLAGVAKVRRDQRVLDTLRDRPGSIEILHILTGGNPRLIRTFYRLLNEGMNGELRHQLERLIDDYTPYHKAIIDALPGQQQRVLDAIALEWNPTDVSTVSRTTRLPSNQVSAQIKALIKSGLISEAANLGHSKKKAYLLTDRFSNIHYLMRHGRTGKLKMHWYVLMLRALFGDKEFAELAAKTVHLTASCGSGLERDSLLLAQNVIDHAGTEEARREFMDRIAGSKEFDGEVNVVLAEKVCRQAIATNPRDAYAHHKFGRLLDVHLKRYTEAEAAYRKAIAIDPTFALPWHNLGNLLSEDMCRYEEAEAAYRKSVKLDPSYAMAWNNLGVHIMKRSGRGSEAADAFRAATSIEPSSAEYWRNFGDALSENRKSYKAAETAYRKATAVNPSDPCAWSALGVLYHNKLRRYKDAEIAYKRVCEIDPNDSLNWSNMGLLLMNKLKRYTEAEQAYLKAASLGADEAMISHTLGNAYTIFGAAPSDDKKALRFYRRAVELAPNNALYRFSLGWLGWWVAAQLSGSDKSASLHAKIFNEDVSAAVKLNPAFESARNLFCHLCFTHPESLRSVLPEVSHWCTQHPDDQSVLSFIVDAWIAYAKCASAKEARELLDAQPDEVKLAFETVRDAFLAHDDKDHLHRLAPERRAPVLKLLQRLSNEPPGQ